MNQYLSKVRRSVEKGADATERLAKSTKLKAELLLLERRIADTKRNFGPDIYDAMAKADKLEVERLFNQCATLVRKLEAESSAKAEQVALLKQPRPHSGAEPEPLDQFSDQPPPAETGTWGAPPPDPPPSTPAQPEALPAGWKKAVAADGKTYYYHPQTGDTSWVPPPADDGPEA